MNRIATLDMLRGYALVCIMLDHMPVGWLRQFTLTNFAVYDAAEMFVLLSGFLVGLVWIKVEAREGIRAAQWRFFRRAVQVWLALLIGSVLVALLSRGLFALDLHHTAIWHEYARWIEKYPLPYIGTVALMWMQPNLLDVLALYVILLASAPVLVPILLRWPVMFFVGSIALWLVSVPLNVMLPNHRVEGGLLFNPFAWQLLFFVGVAMGAFRQRFMPTLRRHGTLVTLIAAAISLYSLAMVVSWRFGPEAKQFGDALWRLVGSVDKWSLDSVRLIAIVAASWLVAVPFARPLGWVASTGAGRALAVIGRGGLFSFVACVLLSVLGDAMDLNPAGGGVPRRLAVDIWVICTLWFVSYLWMNRGRR